MKTSNHRFISLPAFMALLAGIASSGCGGHDTYSPEVLSSQVVTITIKPLNPTTEFPGNIQFTATVTGTSNTGVNWSVYADQEDPGTISNTGVYTPGPNTDGAVTVQAQSKADLSKTASTTVDVILG